MAYAHYWMNGETVDLPVGKAVCVGRNYAEHAQELGNEVPEAPLLFMKPASALRSLADGIVLPQGLGEVHHEIEITVLIGHPLKNADEDTAKAAIAGYGVGLDLTLREVQNQLKAKGHPWERAKAFDGSGILSQWVEARGISTRQHIAIGLEVNGQLRQEGHSGQMLFPIAALLAEISQHFTLQPGDVVFTGTPPGVGSLQEGDQLALRLGNFFIATTEVLTGDSPL